jgi:uncharacterized protein YjbI with pentapeptide repeats
MANDEHVKLLKKGVKAWKTWRQKNEGGPIDLTGADLSGVDLSGVNLILADLSGAILRTANLYGGDLTQADLYGVDFSGANLYGANLTGANLTKANLTKAELYGALLFRARLTEANLTEVYLHNANLIGADLHNANLIGANLQGANLSEADLSGATLTGVHFESAQLVGSNLEYTNLEGCRVYGISAWNLKLKGAQQRNLIITRKGEPVIEVDNIEVAQFIYLLLNNEKIRDVIDTITSKAVLILGRFTPKRKVILDAIREELRHWNYVPILFDFEQPTSRDLTETISTLAHMARFIIADITDAKSIPQELQTIVPNLPGVPVQPLLQKGAKEYAMFKHFKRYPWVLPVSRYDGVEAVRASLKEIITSAEAKAKELLKGEVILSKQSRKRSQLNITI